MKRPRLEPLAEKKGVRARPIWWSRQYIEPFTLSEEDAWRIIKSPPWRCVASWVTKDCKPCCCVMAYLVLDEQIMLSSTSNRNKIKALRRNPAIALSFWGKGMKQVTVRGQVELSADPVLVQRWIAAHLDTWGRSLAPEEQRRNTARYSSPDRLILVVHHETIRSFDGEKMLRAEAEEQHLGVSNA